ncbi:MAG: ribonuclease H-like domain-containing protein [Olpidium bornovanus]|uniref:Ribonuclease H-like domain-containing protein n=1 Tax=Olpidium bornovanus TaxID=278681 RepID=A0A8H7ZNH4_9FUNG|nr:MAG: ribonuclease H-like domain-containing protein [Olpidium bornovanus]
MPTKSSALTQAALEDYVPFIEKHGYPIKVHRSDRGGEFMSDSYQEWLKAHGKRIETTVRETPQQNGIAERINRTLADRARSTMVAAKLPQKLWDEV